MSAKAGGAVARSGRAGDNLLLLNRSPFRQAVSASTWRATWYMLAYLIVGWTLFAAIAGAGMVALLLATTLVGIPVLIAMAAVIRACGNAERRRLRTVLGQEVRGGYRDVSGRGLIARLRAAWTDPAVWRDLAYLGVLFPVLWALDLAVLTVWLTFIGCVALPAWYWTGEQTYSSGTYRGVGFGYFPNGPDGRDAIGIFVDTPAKAFGVALVFLVLSLLFQYVVVRTARMHARIASSLLRAPVDPLGEAKDVLGRSGPLGPLQAARCNGGPDTSGPSGTSAKSTDAPP